MSFNAEQRQIIIYSNNMGLCISREEEELQMKRRMASRTMSKKSGGETRNSKDHQYHNFMQIFQEYQRLGRDYLTRDELKQLFTKIFQKHGNYKTKEQKKEMKFYIETFVKRIDKNSDGLISKQELYQFYQKKK